jgi:hypothetical protein
VVQDANGCCSKNRPAFFRKMGLDVYEDYRFGIIRGLLITRSSCRNLRATDGAYRVPYFLQRSGPTPSAGGGVVAHD